MTVHVFQSSFTKGEITPLAHARSDIEIYQQAAALLRNWCVTKYGGVYRRSGTRFLGRTKFPDRKARFIPFVFNSTGQAYQLEFGDFYIRVWIDQGQVLDGSSVFEIESPYAVDDLALIQTAIYGDTMYIAHPRHHPRLLKRLAHDDWEISTPDLIDGPYLPINDTAATITLSSAPSDLETLDIEWTGIDPFLTEGDIGRQVRFQLDGFWWWAVITDVEPDGLTCEVLVHAVNARTNDDEGGTGTSPSSASTQTRTWRLGAFSAGKPAPVRVILTSGTSWTVPDDWNDADNAIECFGAGGGAGATSTNASGGGGGGAYSRVNNLALTPAASIAYVIGAGGAGQASADGVAGGDTYFNGASLGASSVGAKGGSGNNGGGGGLGGQASAGVGSTKFSGGNGGTRTGSGPGAGGGGAAGASGPGNVGGSAGGAVAGPGGRANGGLGAAGGSGNSSSGGSGSAGANGAEYAGAHGPGGGGGGGGSGVSGAGGAGGSYGGGGGGRGSGSSPKAGGSGAQGLIVITYTPNTAVLHDNPGYPGSVCLFDSRTVWGRTNANPRAVFASYVGLPLRYSPSNAQGTVTASMGFTSDLVSGRVDPILWLMDGARIRIGTASAIRSLGSVDGNSAMGARNISHRLEVPVGASSVQPVEVGTSLAFLSRFGRAVHDLIFDYQTNALVAPELSVLSEHLFKRGATAIAFQDVPDRLLWEIDDDGNLYSTTIERTEKVFAFCSHDLQGEVESISVVPTATRDELWLIVKREIDGLEVRYVEVLEAVFDADLHDIEDAFFLDCGATYEGVATKTVSGLDHLEGETVDALAGGLWFKGMVVTGGVVTLPGSRTFTKIHVGLPIENTGRLLRAPNTAPDGSSLGRKRKVQSVIVDVLGTTSGLKIGTTVAAKKLIDKRKPSMALGEPEPLITGTRKVVVDQDKWEAGAQVEWTVEAPLPALIRAFNVAIESEP